MGMPHFAEDAREHIMQIGVEDGAHVDSAAELEQPAGLCRCMAGHSQVAAASKGHETTKERKDSEDKALHAVGGMANETQSRSPTPSPPRTRSSSPRITIAPCPTRLWETIPPRNYGTVQKDTVFRSGFPQACNLEFMQGLHVRSILTLVDTEPSSPYLQYIREFGLEHKVVSVAANKDGKVATTIDTLCEAIIFILNPRNHPVWVHCNQGRHRTGCVIACLRKVQEWPLDEVLAEYDAYASPKARIADIELITNFKPDSIIAYAKAHGKFDWTIRRIDSLQGLKEVTSSSLLPHDSTLLADWSSEDSELAEELVQEMPLPSLLLPRAKSITTEEGVTIIDYARQVSALSHAAPDREGDVQMTTPGLAPVDLDTQFPSPTSHTSPFEPPRAPRAAISEPLG